MATAQEIWEYATRTLSTSPPTAVQIRQEVNSLMAQLAAIQTLLDQSGVKDIVAKPCVRFRSK